MAIKEDFFFFREGKAASAWIHFTYVSGICRQRRYLVETSHKSCSDRHLQSSYVPRLPLLPSPRAWVCVGGNFHSQLCAGAYLQVLAGSEPLLCQLQLQRTREQRTHFHQAEIPGAPVLAEPRGLVLVQVQTQGLKHFIRERLEYN